MFSEFCAIVILLIAWRVLHDVFSRRQMWCLLVFEHVSSGSLRAGKEGKFFPRPMMFGGPCSCSKIFCCMFDSKTDIRVGLMLVVGYFFAIFFKTNLTIPWMCHMFGFKFLQLKFFITDAHSDAHPYLAVCFSRAPQEWFPEPHCGCRRACVSNVYVISVANSDFCLFFSQITIWHCSLFHNPYVTKYDVNSFFVVPWI